MIQKEIRSPKAGDNTTSSINTSLETNSAAVEQRPEHPESLHDVEEEVEAQDYGYEDKTSCDDPTK